MHKTFGKKSNYQPEQLILIGRFFIKGQGNDTLATGFVKPVARSLYSLMLDLKVGKDIYQ